MSRRSVRMVFGAVIALAIPGAWAPAQNALYPKAKVSFSDYRTLVSEVEVYRESHLVSLAVFLEMAKDPETIVLDARSDSRFERLHLKGARHLSFTDFTQQNLAGVIPGFRTRILIYCNNNFDGNQTDFPSKIAFPETPASQMGAQNKPIMLALNIPTYVNLYGYGYRNVYELDELVRTTDPRIVFEGSVASRPSAGTFVIR